MNSSLLDNLDKKILWVVGHNGEPMTISNILDKIQSMSDDSDKIKRTTLRYRVTRLLGNYRLLRKVNHKRNTRWVYVVLSKSGIDRLDMLPELFDELVVPANICSTRPFLLTQEVNENISLCPIENFVSMFPAINIPNVFPALSEILSYLDYMVRKRKNSVFLYELRPLLYLFFSSSNMIGFKQWMIHRWLVAVKNNTKYFDLNFAQLRKYRISPHTRKRYQPIINPDNLQNYVTGKGHQEANRLRVQSLFRIWVKTPFNGLSNPVKLWDNFLSDVFPDLYKAIYVDSITRQQFHDTEILPAGAFGHDITDQSHIYVSIGVKEFYYLMKEWARVADFSTLVNERVRHLGQVVRPATILFNGLLKHIKLTSAENLTQAWENFRSNVERSDSKKSNVIAGLPYLNADRVCQTTVSLQDF